MTRYINTKYNNTVETVDTLRLIDFSDYKSFRRECQRLAMEYTKAYGQRCYISQRKAK